MSSRRHNERASALHDAKEAEREQEKARQGRGRCPLFSFCQLPRCVPSQCVWALGQQGRAQ
ncbi:MAG: hypothetical protein F9K47_01980 [Burkholderiales bacterium]|nr:MAG: hypothetical protein F9K47_01980 [Burkholderiales bacterium]